VHNVRLNPRTAEVIESCRRILPSSADISMRVRVKRDLMLWGAKPEYGLTKPSTTTLIPEPRGSVDTKKGYTPVS
jgi:hypothetical protein